MGKIIGFKCVKCGKEYGKEYKNLTCETCGISGILDIQYDYNSIKISRGYFENKNLPQNHWRYKFIMPFEEEDKVPDLKVGFSPLYVNERIAKEYGFQRLLIKDDGLNPTASLKDRASSVGVGLAHKEGKEHITCASTGNAASSLAGSSAAMGIKAYIFVPQRAPLAKIAQCLIFGAKVFVVKGSYEDAFRLSMQCAEKFGFYNRNSGINPYLVEGKKTVSFEICEQNNWQVPDYLIMSVGDGCSIAAAWKGMEEFYKIGLIDKTPKMIGVQAEGAAPIYKVWKNNLKELKPEIPKTLADSIAVGTPRNWIKAVNAIKKSGGMFITVSDEEILQAIRELGEKTGISSEPAGATSFAGMKKLAKEGFFSKNDTVAIVISGNGLKDIDSLIKAARNHFEINPDINEVKDKILK